MALSMRMPCQWMVVSSSSAFRSVAWKFPALRDADGRAGRAPAISPNRRVRVRLDRATAGARLPRRDRAGPPPRATCAGNGQIAPSAPIEPAPSRSCRRSNLMGLPDLFAVTACCPCPLSLSLIDRHGNQDARTLRYCRDSVIGADEKAPCPLVPYHPDSLARPPLRRFRARHAFACKSVLTLPAGEGGNIGSKIRREVFHA